MAYFIVRPQYKKSSSGGIYGVVWDGSSTTAWTRTDDAVNFLDPIPAINNGTGSSPFDNIMPWAGMVKVEDEVAGTLVAIPKFYFKLEYANPTATVKGLKIQISPNYFEGSQISPAHMDRGDGSGERNIIYVGRYHCANSVFNYKSMSGKPIANKLNRATFRSNIKSLGTGIWQWDYATLLTIQILYLVEFADWNSQAKIGYGCGNGSSDESTGKTDNMQYHTGTNASSRTTYGHIQYRNIEDLWANVLDWCDGIYINSNKIYAIKNPADFSDSNNGTIIGDKPSIAYDYITEYSISSTSGFTWFMYPTKGSGGSSSTYVCDTAYYYRPSFTVGGYYSQSQSSGLFHLESSLDSYSAEAYVGSRLMKLP